MITLSVKAGQPHRTESAKKLAAKAVILIHPERHLGECIWH